MDEKAISQKLNAPKKISGFEKQRQEAESKRLREEAETRKALRDFEDSFAEEDDDDDPLSALIGGRIGGGGFGGGVRDAPTGPRRGGAMEGSLDGPRHFSQPMRNSGPGTLGPPPSLKRKRELEEERERRERESRGGMRGFDNYNDSRSGRRKSPEPAVKRPTMLLAQLPNTIKEADIKQLMPATLKVEEVAFIPSTTPGTDRRYLSAIVTVAASTPMSDVDSAVSLLQGRYLGFGSYLKISRHITSSLNNQTSSIGSHTLSSQLEFQPFGAKPWVRDVQIHSLRNAPPPGSLDSSNGGYQSYVQQPLRNQGPPPMVVTVTPPSDLKLLKAIHKTAEKVVQYGALFEQALLASLAVQHDESWAWLFDASSQGNVYYRYLICEYHAGQTLRQAKETKNAATIADLNISEDWKRSPEGQFAKQNGLLKLFDKGPLWQPPRDRLKFEFVTDFEDLVDDGDYVSSDDDSGDEGPSQSRPNQTTGSLSLDFPASGKENSAGGYLNPYRRAKLTHLLARLPDAIALLRAGDVARITNFVVSNAGSGAEEIVAMLIENIEIPYSRAVVYETSLSELDDDLDEDEMGEEEWAKRETRRKNEEEKKRNDPSNAKLIALYVVSDALQASSTSGVRDAWKYRGLFESALKSRRVFEHLGRLERLYKWGRMKSEQWKRKVGVVLGLWEKSSVFSAETQKVFRDSFLNPPLTGEEKAEKERVEKEESDKREGVKWKSGTSTPSTTPAPAGKDLPSTNIDAQPTLTEPPKTEAQREAEAKIKAATDKLATMKRAAAARAARPTAADLLDKKEEILPPVAPAPAPAPKISVGGLKINLGSGAGAGLSLGSKKVEAENTDERKERRGPAADMFGDSDGE